MKKRHNNNGNAMARPGAMLKVVFPLPFYVLAPSPMRVLETGEIVMFIGYENEVNCKLVTSTGIVGYAHVASLKGCTSISNV
jgi:hypothetical protein